jgi:pimeloyl-ACP methyl ester carboxylesterase
MIDIGREFPCVNSASGGAMVRIENAGHNLFVDNPRGFAQAVVAMADVR